MTQGFEIIFFAAIAGYVFFRLWTVLGQTTIEKPNHLKTVHPIKRDTAQQDDTIVTVPNSLLEEEDLLSEKAKQGFQKLLIIQPTFDLGHFLQGSQTAFSLIVKAFSEGDRDTLKHLISEDIYKPFDKAISSREKANQKLESRIDSVRVDKIEDVTIDDGEVTITLRFHSEQMTATVNAEGEIIDNPARLTIPVIDIWSFRRHINAKGPNWLLIATRTETSKEQG